MDRAERQVLTRLAREFYRPAAPRELAQELELALHLVEKALASLCARGVLKRGEEGYCFNPGADLIAGYFQTHPRGYGFVHTGDDRQYYVPPGTARGAGDGDIVLAEVQAREPGKAPLVQITDILHRRQRYLVGQFRAGSGLGSVQDGTRKILIPVRAARGAREGAGVVVAVSGYEGRVVCTLPDEDLGRLDLLNIAARRGILPLFPPAVEEEAARLAAQDLGRREDMRDMAVVTVDGQDVWDLDDGFSLFRLENGNWLLGVHVADVAHYVAGGSALDREALRRSFSIYLLDREIPMLPARLSRDLCSLLPGRERPAVSCLVELTPAGQVVSFRFAETVICSRARLTYQQAAEGRCGPWQQLIAAAMQLAGALAQRRRQRGAAYIALPATAIVLDAAGRPLAMGPRRWDAAREMVEEFMILANELAAEYLHQRGMAFLHRGNAGFHPGRGEEVNAFIARWGYKLQYPPPARELQQFLDRLQGRPEMVPVSRKLARCLQKSRYSAAPLGHYNLALERYTHFSSPIRRYSDLFVQRQIKAAVRGVQAPELARELPRAAELCSYKERLVQDVEGECLEQKKLEYLEARPGEIFAATVADTTPGGPWVMLDNTAEGMVVAGARSKLQEYVPGDRVQIKVHKLDYRAKQAYFALAGVDSGQE
ncbi:MAG TPA: RNB domain-containing ribonuclease [Bacillota bacterium]|nr:RNB domain-containing ribonuclease [Bacillota bacterium]